MTYELIPELELEMENGLKAEATKPASAAAKSKPPAKPATPDWTIAHSARGRFTLVFRRRMKQADVLKLLFNDGTLVPGFKLQEDPNGLGARWLLFIPQMDTIMSQAARFTKKLADALTQAAASNVLALTPEEAAAIHAAYRKYNDRISKVYLPFLGMTFGQALKTYQLGWFEKNGYFIWIGVTTEGTELQAAKLSEYDSVNRDMRWYLNKAMSIKQAQQEIHDRGFENLRMLVVGMMGA